MKIYIAGPITGILEYRENFARKEKELIEKGHIVLNPAYLPSGLKDYMPICKAMIDQAEMAYFLFGWEDSIGSMEEYEYAKGNGKRICYQIEFDERVEVFK